MAATTGDGGSPAAQEADGVRLFRQRCGVCHQIGSTRNGVGPHLQGLNGRSAGTVERYPYSSALKSSGISWSSETLDTYLTNPGAMVRGTKMVQRFANTGERTAIVEFLLSR